MMLFEHYGANISTHLEIDEKLLSLSEMCRIPIFRIWESDQYAVVLGKSNRIDTEVVENACSDHHIPIYRRESGGGTVILGPGSLNYTIIMPFSPQEIWASISETTTHIMSLHQQALSFFLSDIEVQGVSDLTYKGKKFSGNAQRRKREAFLFHGTFLYQFDLKLISTHLSIPTKQPDYRQSRPHHEFVNNIPLSRDQLQQALIQAWQTLK